MPPSIAQELARAEQELALVRAEIDRVTKGGQGYTSGDTGLAMQRADVEKLYARERELLTRVQRLNRGGGLRVGYGAPCR